MTWLQSSTLGWLALAAIPIILYIIFRRRKNEVDWGATYIMKLALASGRRQTLWKQLVVIALRTIMLALLVMAFARPFQQRSPEQMGDNFPHGQGALHRIILVDNSLSMNARYGMGTRMDESRTATRALLTSLRAGDTAHLVTMCPADGTAVTPQPIELPVNTPTAQALTDSIGPQATPLQMAAAMRAAVEAFRHGAANNRQLVIITDLARSDYPRLDDLEFFGSMLADLEVRVAILNLGASDQQNLAIDGISTGSERLLAGQPTHVYIDVINYSDVPAESSQLTFLIDGKVADEQPCILAPGQRRQLQFQVSLDAGEHRLEARLSDDAYTADNRIERFVYASDQLRILLVAPKPDSADAFSQPAVFVERALAAITDQPYRFEVESLQPEMLTAQNFQHRDVVMLCDPGLLATSVRSALTTFVRRGGGLLISAGPGADPEPLNRDLAQLLPATLTTPYRPDLDTERYQQIQATEIPLPLLHEFESGVNGDLARARIYNHWQAEPAANSQTVLRLTNGDPILIHQPFGQGRVLLWTTSIGGAWTSLPVRQAYLPFVSRMLNHAAGSGRAPRNVMPAEPLISTITAAGNTVFLTTPDADLIEVPVVNSGDQRFARIDGQQQPGTYYLRDQQGATLAEFSIAIPLAESDLRMLKANNLERLKQLLHAQLAQETTGLSKALWRQGDGRELSAWLLATVFLLLMMDAAATRWFFS